MSSISRVTQRSVAAHSLAGLQGNLTRVASLQQKLSSGRQISRPSDSPSGTSAALQFRVDIKRNAQWSRNADDGLGWLGALDNTLTGMNTSVQKVRELTLQGMSTGSVDQSAREALATEVDQLRQALVAQANTAYLGRPVFAGTTAGAVAYDDLDVIDADGNPSKLAVFRGNVEPVMRTVAANSAVRVDLPGPDAFGTATTDPAAPAQADLFATLTKIARDLRLDPSLLGNDLTTLDGQQKMIQNKLSDVGARYNRLEKARQGADDRGLDATNSLANVESIDLPETIMQLEMANVAYQAALGATAKAIQPSLMDFLR